jgi:hypothetical protein
MDRNGMARGTPPLASVGPITFGDDDVLFVADNVNATVFAIDVADPDTHASRSALDVDALDAKLAASLGCDVDDVVIRELAVHPRTNNVYLSVMRGRGEEALPVLIRVGATDASISEVELHDVAYSAVEIANAPSSDDPRTDRNITDPPDGDELEITGVMFRVETRPVRMATVTDLAYVDGILLVAGMSNEEFSSNLRRIPFPFSGEQPDAGLEIYHVSHRAWETAAPIRTFTPYAGGTSILASYTCTPLVHFPLSSLTNGRAVGRTVAELGSRSQPLDLITYSAGGHEYALVAHSRYPMTKIACEDIDAQTALTDPEHDGVPRSEIDLAGVRRLANFGDEFVLALIRDDAGGRHLRSLKTTSL